MITLTARIELREGGAVGGVSLQGNTINNEQTINISSPINEVIGKHENVMSNTFTLGESDLGGGGTYANHLNYFMGRVKSNATGEFAEDYVLSVSGSNIQMLTICFNKLNNEFPNYVYVDDEKFMDDDYKWEISFDKAQQNHTITISNWNTPYSPLVITSIYADVIIELNNGNLMNIKRRIADRANIKYPQYGIVSNQGSVDFIDIDETILDLLIQQQLGENKIDIYINNTDLNRQEKIASLYTKEWTYDNDNREVLVIVKDLLERWQVINVPAIYYVPTISTPKPLSYIYNYLHDITVNNGFDMIAFEDLDENTKNTLNTEIQYPVLEDNNLWEEWDKLCKIALAHIYIDNNGKVIFKCSI